MTFAGCLADAITAALVRLLTDVDDDQLHKIPQTGPLILATNHVNFLEVPVLRTRLRSRRVIGLAKAEAWKNPLLRWLFNQWDAIPVRRGETDIGALRQALAVLKSGGILGLAPEGTRSGHGRLQKAHSGIATIALKSAAPILPVVFHGGEAFRHNIAHLRRTPFHFAVGKPFRVVPGGATVTRKVRQQIADEIMYQLSALLPPAYRGYYANLEATSERHLRFSDSSQDRRSRSQDLNGAAGASAVHAG